jgi:hypothetical protein
MEKHVAPKAAIPAPPLAALAPLADASSGRPSEPRPAAAMATASAATLTRQVGDPPPPPRSGTIDELVPEMLSPNDVVSVQRSEGLHVVSVLVQRACRGDDPR